MFLFERLDSGAPLGPRARLAQSLDQVVAAQYLADPEAPLGILNFGLPRAVDVPIGDAGGKAYAAQVAARIRQFEPRLRNVRVTFTNGKVHVRGAFGADEPTDFEWRTGKSHGAE